MIEQNGYVKKILAVTVFAYENGAWISNGKKFSEQKDVAPSAVIGMVYRSCDIGMKENCTIGYK